MRCNPSRIINQRRKTQIIDLTFEYPFKFYLQKNMQNYSRFLTFGTTLSLLASHIAAESEEKNPCNVKLWKDMTKDDEYECRLYQMQNNNMMLNENPCDVESWDNMTEDEKYECRLYHMQNNNMMLPCDVESWDNMTEDEKGECRVYQTLNNMMLNENPGVVESWDNMTEEEKDGLPQYQILNNNMIPKKPCEGKKDD